MRILYPTLLLISANVFAQDGILLNPEYTDIDFADTGKNVGRSVQAVKATKTIEVNIEHNEFNFSNSNIYNGDIVQFVIYNRMNIDHAFTITDTPTSTIIRDKLSHADIDHFGWKNTISVPAGDKREITWLFSGEGYVTFMSLNTDLQYSIVTFR